MNGKTDGLTDGRTENRTSMSHTAKQVHKMAAKAINRKKLKAPSAAKRVEGSYNNFIGMILGLPSTKIAQTVPLCEENGHQDYKWK